LGVILLSGGLDSTTVATFAKKKGYELAAITLQYGQKHSKELEAAKKIADVLGIKHETFDVSFFGKIAWYSALTTPGSFDVPKMRSREDLAGDIPVTYVPLRNTFFITIAAAFLESLVLNLIERGDEDPGNINSSLFIAANAIDYSGYPDCRPKYYREMVKTLALGSKLGTQYRRKIKIETPVINKTKAEIVKMAMELGAPLEYTWSCYEGGVIPCGSCDSCILRAKGFAEAGYEDPLLTRLRENANIAKGE
jgi:7-cyano-7-deazaguanine synthase